MRNSVSGLLGVQSGHTTTDEDGRVESKCGYSPQFLISIRTCPVVVLPLLLLFFTVIIASIIPIFHYITIITLLLCVLHLLQANRFNSRNNFSSVPTLGDDNDDTWLDGVMSGLWIWTANLVPISIARFASNSPALYAPPIV